jgi:hypothetical protein
VKSSKENSQEKKTANAFEKASGGSEFNLDISL